MDVHSRPVYVKSLTILILMELRVYQAQAAGFTSLSYVFASLSL